MNTSIKLRNIEEVLSAQSTSDGDGVRLKRVFETVTYMLEGKMEHRDHMGNVGLLGPGDVQWMKAGYL